MPNELDPRINLDAIVRHEPPHFRFEAADPASAERWQDEARTAVRQALGFLDRPPVDPEPRLVETTDCGSWVRRKVMLRTDTQSVMPCHILYPKQLKSPAPCVLALHGHGQGVNEIIGMGPTAQSSYQKDFACRLAEQGFIVAAPEIAGFGQRGIDHRYLTEEETVPESCYHLASYALMLGGTHTPGPAGR